jgi:beta-lactamase regulating signal transducer with metallopeptidase domain
MTSWLLHSFEAVTLLMLLVLALRRPVARLFGAGWAYALWLIPAFRLVLPPLPLPAQDLPPSAAVLIPAASDMTAPLPASAGPGQWVPFLLACWAGGAVIFLILQWLGYRAFLRRLDGTARPARPDRYGGIATFVSRMVEGPLALGLIEPRIFLPADFSRRYSPGERRLALEHELTHHRHRDIWWNMAAIAMLAANWFNPLAWLAYRAFRADQELACDAAVAARATIEERCDYARALVKSAAGPALIAACPINGAGALKHRLRMLRGHRASPMRSAGGMAALSVLAVAGATSATLRSAPAEMPQLMAAIAPRPVLHEEPVKVALAPAPHLGRVAARAPARVVHRHASVEMAAAVPKLDLPPFGTQSALPTLAAQADGPTFAAFDMPEPPEAGAPPAPPAPPAAVKAVSFRFSGWVGEPPVRKAAKNLTMLYRLADPAQRKQIEAAVRAAVAQAQQARAQARLALRLAEQTGSSNGTAWQAVQYQIVEQDD